MAVVFELVVRFGDNDASASAAEMALQWIPPLVLDGAEHQIEGPWISSSEGVIHEFSVGVGGINRGGVDAHHLPRDQVIAIAGYLYETLQKFDGYQLAIVGWDPEWAVDPSELREHLSHDDAKPPAGLVVADGLAHELGLEALDEFQPGFRSSPWQLPQGWTPH